MRCSLRRVVLGVAALAGVQMLVFLLGGLQPSEPLLHGPPGLPHGAVFEHVGRIPSPWVHASLQRGLRSVPKSCQTTNQDTSSSILRAQTWECKQLIKETDCFDQAKQLYPPTVSIEGNCSGPMSIPPDAPQGKSATIAFMIVANGRSLRQVKRLFLSMYRPEHLYLIHVDDRSDYLFNELVPFIAPYPNAWLTSWRLGSIWGASNLYEVYFRGLADLLHREWDYFVNLSETDMPIQPIEKLSAYLGRHKDKHTNFLRSHGKDHKRFVRKQGLDRTFLFCEHHMWRLGQRSLPPQLHIEGGSDWFMFHRSFAEWLVRSKHPLISELRAYYEYSLLAAESFFHVALTNGPLCGTFHKDNHRHANWNRKRGCRCQYKHVVDWCGCSPNVFLPEDLGKIQAQVHKNVFFARKFDGKISNNIINLVESDVLGISNGLNKEHYWESKHKRGEEQQTDPASLTYFLSFARLAAEQLRGLAYDGHCTAKLHSILEVHLVMKDDVFLGYSVWFGLTDQEDGGDIVAEYEALVTPNPQQPTFQRGHAGGRLLALSLGTQWDEKERVFHKYGGLLGRDDPLVAVQTWSTGKALKLHTSWKTPSGQVAGEYQMDIKADWTISFVKPGLLKPLEPGLWTLRVHEDDKRKSVYATANVLVVKTSLELADTYDQDPLVGDLWSVHSMCAAADEDPCFRLPPCRTTEWSSLSDASQLSGIYPSAA